MAKGVYVRVKSSIPSVEKMMRDLGVGSNGDVQSKLTDIILRNVKDFMPKRSGALIAATRKVTPTLIKTDKPYAAYMFFGKRKDGTPLRYDTSKNVMAGSFWNRRLYAERGARIAREIQGYARRKAVRY